jgi:hypothetical protein
MCSTHGFGINVKGAKRISLEKCLNLCGQIISTKRLKEFLDNATFEVPMTVSLSDFFQVISMCQDIPSFKNKTPIMFCGKLVSSISEINRALDTEYDLEVGDSKYKHNKDKFMSKFRLDFQSSIRKLEREEEMYGNDSINTDSVKMPSLAHKVSN